MTNPTSPLLAGWLAGPVVLQLLAELEAADLPDPAATLRLYLGALRDRRRGRWREEWLLDPAPGVKP